MEGVIPDGHGTVLAPEFVNDEGYSAYKGGGVPEGQEELRGARTRESTVDRAAEEVRGDEHGRRSRWSEVTELTLRGAVHAKDRRSPGCARGYSQIWWPIETDARSAA